MTGEHHPSLPLRLVLASQSPRRSELLRRAGFTFTIAPTQISEIPDENLNLPDQIRDLARQKARACLSLGKVAKGQGNLVLAADTVVVLDGQILGKPANREENRQYLRRLSGRKHSVITAVCLFEIDSGRLVCEHDETFVAFRKLNEAEIEEYAVSDHGLDKAGGYGIQSAQARNFVESLKGAFDTVVGLPMDLVQKLLRENGWHVDSR